MKGEHAVDCGVGFSDTPWSCLSGIVGNGNKVGGVKGNAQQGRPGDDTQNIRSHTKSRTEHGTEEQKKSATMILT